MKKFIVILIIVIGILFSSKSYAKYVINEKYEIINIKNADLDKPYINGRNYDIDYENKYNLFG